METFVVPRRKVPARVRLADSTALEGSLYAPVAGSLGRPGRMVDRLNDAAERYLPLALHDRHVLVHKSRIVAVELSESDGGIGQSSSAYARELRLRVALLDGSTVQGRTYAEMPPSRARVLDFLNATVPRFIPLLRDDGVVIVNGDYIVAVSEDLGNR